MGNEKSNEQRRPPPPDAGNKGNKGPWNPINQILKTKNIDSLKNKWDRDELFLFEERIKPFRNDGLTLQDFLLLFPRLEDNKKKETINGFSKKTQRRIYQLFHRFSTKENLSNQELLEGITMIRMSDNVPIFSRMVFFLYGEDNKEMHPEGFKNFLAENKTRVKSQNKLAEFNQWNPKRPITTKQFEEKFQHFEMKKFIELFEADFIIEEEHLIQQLKVIKNFSREVGSQVYLVEFQWYMQWKDYMNHRYGIDPKIKDRDGRINREEIIQKSRIKIKSQNQLEYQYEFNGKEMKRPGVIPNYKLIGDQLHELKKQMKEFTDFIMVPAWLWHSLQKIYRGHPTIKRMFPQVYCLKIYQVSVDEEARFIPNLTEQLQLTYNEMKIREIIDPKYLGKNVCILYKYPGLENWKQIQDVNYVLGAWICNCKTYVVVMDKKLKRRFIERYNVVSDSKGNKKVEERVRNYASLLHMDIHGVFRQGFVTKVSEDSVYIEYRNQQNSKFEKRFFISKLAQKNPNYYNQREAKNLLSGFYNKKKDSYEHFHAVIQCLIRTPYFGNYLKKIPQIMKGYKNYQSLVIKLLSQIAIESESLTGVVNTTQITTILDEKVKRMEKDGFVDAFLFLTKLLFKLEREYKDEKKSIVKQKPTQLEKGESPEPARNIKIQQFFQTQGEIESDCQKCHHKETVSQNIYGHTLQFPTFNQVQVFFYFFPKIKPNRWLPIKYGVSANSDITKEQFFNRASELMGMLSKNLVFYACFDGEWKHDIKNDKQHKYINEYLELGMKIVVYQIQNENNLFYELRSRNLKKSRNKFVSFSVPVMLEVAKEDTWKDILDQISHIFEGKYGDNKHKYEKGNEPRNIEVMNSSSRLRSASKMKSEYNIDGESKISQVDDSASERSNSKRGHASSGQINRETKYTNKFYTVRVVKNDHSQRCFKCGKSFIKKGSLQAGCKGYCFKENLVLSEDPNMSKHHKNISIVVDWLSPENFTGFDNLIDNSAELLKNDSEKKKLELNVMLKNNPTFKEIGKCSKCSEFQAIKNTKIQQYPNILMIRFKRFSLKDGRVVKNFNKVEYPDLLFHEGEKYQLYGTVAHDGPPSSGVYYNYVKCHDYPEWFKCHEEKVKKIEEENSHVSPDAYILFYKKADMDPALMFFNPLI